MLFIVKNSTGRYIERLACVINKNLVSLVDQDHQSRTIKVIREISMALLKHIPEFMPWRRTETGSVPTGFSYRSWLTHTFNSSHTH